MFSGIVRYLGVVSYLNKRDEGMELSVTSSLFLDCDIQEGDSIAVNGVCLTVSSILKDSATFYAINETLNKTNLGDLALNASVHLERSLRVGETIDGHFVYGHIDGVVKLREIVKDGNSHVFTFEVPSNLSNLIALKGSLSLDGVSLTVSGSTPSTFSVSIVPHTFQNTLFSSYVIGDRVNLEIDCLMRYVEKYLSSMDKK